MTLAHDDAAAAAAGDARELAALLDRGLRALGLPLPDDAREKLLRYVALLARWNRTYNLTAIREPARMVTHHLLDCLAALPVLDRLAAGRALAVLDVGSGAGLPGIPLAIARPQWQVTMVEPVQKKGAFLVQAIAELGLANARAAVARVEELAAPAPFDVAISRAFADLAAFVQAAMPRVARDGRLVAMKGVHPDAELAELPATVEVEDAPALAVPFLDGARHLVIMRRRVASLPPGRSEAP
jgi:16S rRNA (guanine527-N7)-methyltransferase